MKDRFNLIPDGYLTQKTLDAGRFIIFTLVILFVAGMVSLGILYEKRFIQLEGSIQRLNYQKNQLLFEEASAQMILDRIAQIEAEDADGREVLNLLNGLVRDRIQWSKIMAQVTYIVPEGVWLNSLSSSGEGSHRKIKFRGAALSNKWVARFLFYLENHPDFSDVRLEYSRQIKIGERELYSFEVDSTLKAAGGRI